MNMRKLDRDSAAVFPRLRMNSGFTIVELLVVIAIVGVLVSLILPAINATRESGRRLSCQNNLKNIGLAVLQFSESNKEQLPSIAKTNRPQLWQNLSWRYQLLPYLDKRNLYDRFDTTAVPFGETNLPLTQIGVGVFECPSTPGSSSGRKIPTMGVPPESVECSAAASDYVAIYDVRQPQRSFPLRGVWNPDLRDPQLLEESPTPPGSDGTFEDGLTTTAPDGSVLQSHRHVRSSFVTVRDGLSNTALVIEQAGRPKLEGRDSADMEDDRSEGAWATAELGSFSGEGINIDNRRNPYGFHRAAQVVMCDGSVHTWTIDMSPEVMQALLSASGKEIIADTDW